MAHAEIHRRRGGWWTVVPSPFRTADSRAAKGFRSEDDANAHASALADTWAVEARGECPCGTDGGDGECGVLEPHGISIQECDGGE